MAYDVFISFKNSDENGNRTKDSLIAAKLYESLAERGVRAFFSNEVLEHTGKSQYTLAIDDALDSSNFLVAVGASRENFNSQWVRYEWESFINDIRSGIKPNAEVFCLYSGISVRDLPRALRQQQAFNADEEDSYARLCNFIKNAMCGAGTTPPEPPESPEVPEPPKVESKPEVAEVPIPPLVITELNNSCINKAVAVIIEAACRADASELRIEPDASRTCVHFMIGGEYSPRMTVDSCAHFYICNRLKRLVDKGKLCSYEQMEDYERQFGERIDGVYCDFYVSDSQSEFGEVMLVRLSRHERDES